MQNAKCKIILATAQQKHPPQKFFLRMDKAPVIARLGTSRGNLPLLILRRIMEITAVATLLRNDDLYNF